MKTLLLSLSLFLAPASWGRRPIDGGEDVKVPIPDIVRIYNGTRICTATRISEEWFITAAHCIVSADLNNRSIEVPGMKVVSVHVNQKYIDAKNQSTDKEYACDECVANDLALIKVRPGLQPKKTFFARLLDQDTKFTRKRSSITLYGFGMTKAFWNGKDFELDELAQNLQTGQNQWDDCDFLNFQNPVSDLEKVSRQMAKIMSFKGSRTHTVYGDGSLVIGKTAAPSLLGGDSGGPVIEKDAQGRNTITGINASVGQNGTNFKIVVEDTTTGKVLELPLTDEQTKEEKQNWGLASLPHSHFKYIDSYLKKANLLDPSGKLPAKYRLGRSYELESRNNVTNLATPDNQEFIRKVLEGK